MRREQPQEPWLCFLLWLPDLGEAGAGPAGPPRPPQPGRLTSFHTQHPLWPFSGAWGELGSSTQHAGPRGVAPPASRARLGLRLRPRCGSGS